MSKVLVIGYGSIGKRHASNLVKLNINPIVYDICPIDDNHIQIVNEFPKECKINNCIIATPTASHYNDFLNITKRTNIKNILIEKPIDIDLSKAEKILELSIKLNIKVRIAYNLRYLYVFEKIKEIIRRDIDNIRIIKISCGQYLPDWRPNIDYRKNYSAHRKLGGGVDLDLSHEIDYMLWLFGYPKKRILKYGRKISFLDIDSIDYFKCLYDYGDFIVDLELDYIRKRERTLRIIGENRDILCVDFTNQKLIVDDEEIGDESLFNIDESYELELKEFLGLSNTTKLCTIEESMKVLELLGNKYCIKGIQF